MRSDVVVSNQLVVGDLPHPADRVERVGVEHLLAVRAVEPFDERVLVGLDRPDEAQPDVRGLAPVVLVET